MLVGFAAVLTVTSAVSGLTGAFVLPADQPAAAATFSVSAAASTSTAGLTTAGLTTVGTSTADTTTASVGDAPVSAVGDAPTTSGAADGSSALVSTSLLGSIAEVDAGSLPAFLHSHGAELDRLLASPPAPADVGRMWRLLDPAKQKVLVDEEPHLIGNLEGVPYEVRGRANLLDLRRTIADAKHQLETERGKAERLELQRRLTTLGNVRTALKSSDGVARTLVGLDTSDDAKASIVVGDLSTAQYVSVLVPGMYMSVGEQMEGWAKVAQDLHDQQVAWLHRLLGPRSSSGTPGVAVVAWIGYQTPVLTNIGGLQLAEQGADSLERTLEGIEALRQENPPYLSVFAHSYGSTAALLALERHSVTVDALALMGSPGSDAQSVGDLAVRGGNVFVGEASMDPIVNSAFFGSDPGSPSYGAKAMGVDGAVDPITHLELTGSSGHNEYFTAGTECMRNLALIGIDQGRLVLSGSSGAGTDEDTGTQAASSR